MGAVKDFFSGDATKNEKRVDVMHDTQEAIIEAEAYAMSKSEQYSESEISEYLSERNKKNEESRKDMMAEAKKATNKAIGINILGVAASVGLAGSAVASKSSTISNGLSKAGAKIASGAKGVAAASKSGIKTLGSAIAKKVPALGKVASSKVVTTIGKGTAKVASSKVVTTIGKGTAKAVSTAGKVVGTAGKVVKTTTKYAGKGIGKISSKHPIMAAGLTMSPLAATQIYTRIKASDRATELDDAISNLNIRLENMEENKDKWGEDFKTDCEAFLGSYNEACNTLLDKYNEGKMSEEEYSKTYEEMAKEYTDKLEVMKDKFPGVMRSAEYEASMVEAAASSNDKEKTLKNIIENSWMQAEQHELNPEVYEKCEIIAENRNGTAETGFGRFWKSLNSTIIKYVPAVAYIEATALKAVDSTYDFIRDAIVGDDKKSKYQDESITSLAKSIQTDCAEHLEKREIATNTIKEMREDGTSVDEFRVNSQTALAQLEDKYIGNENTESENTGTDYALV